MIEVRGVSKFYGTGDLAALRDVSLTIATGEFVVLVGESGSGKSTLLSTINRLLSPSSGKIFIEGEDAATRDPIALRRQIGFVFQDVGLFPHLTVAENIAITPRLLGWEAKDIAARVAELLTLIHLPQDCATRMPDELSGGQRQRVGVARALAAKPGILLMDEPFGALDPVTRAALAQDLRDIHDRLGLTTIFVTHDMTEALLLGDRVAVMRDGKILQVDSPQVLATAPANDFVRALMELPRQQAQKLAHLLAAAPA